MSLFIENTNNLISVLQESNPIRLSVPSAVDVSSVALTAATQALNSAILAQTAASALSGVQAYGAVGNGVTSDQAAFDAAFAVPGPVFVPWTANNYVLTSLSAANRKRLYGFGDVFVGGVKVPISTEPYVGDDDAHLRVYNEDWNPSKWSSVDGSLYAGGVGINMIRTGGFGTYGMLLANLTVSDATPSPEFDVAMTAWTTHRNLTGGSAFGAWFGVLGPSPALGHTFTSGSLVGAEFNVGSREMTTLKVQPDGAKDSIGVKIVPDAVPSIDGAAFETVSNITIASPGVITKNAHGYYNGLRLRIYARTGILPGGFTEGSLYYVVNATTNTFQLSATYGGTPINTTGTFGAGVAVLPSYPSHFGLNISRSIWTHQFHTGIIMSADTIVPGGIGIRLRGGSTAAQGPGNMIFLDGASTNGINVVGTLTNGLVVSGSGVNGLNLSVGTFSNAAILLGANQGVEWSASEIVSTGSNVSVNTTTGGFTVPRLTTTQRDAVGTWADGTVIYNTTIPAFQGRQAGAWVNL